MSNFDHVYAEAVGREYPVPPGTTVVKDDDARQWTNVSGAAAIAGKSRRTIFLWMKHGWVAWRRLPNRSRQILVASLWADPGGDADAPAAATAAMPTTGGN